MEKQIGIEISNPIARDDRGCLYKYSNRRVAEMKVEMIIKKMIKQTFKIVEI